MAIALDGSVIGNSGGASSFAVSLTTTNANDIIIVHVTTNAGPVTSISDTAGLTWAKRTSGGDGTTSKVIEEWFAVAPNALTSDSITVNTTGSGFITVIAFGISGADLSTIWDNNSAVPPHATGDPSGTVSFTTSQPNAFLTAGYRMHTTATPAAGTGWTLIKSGNFAISEYQIVSATQLGLAGSLGGGATDQNGGVGDAVIQQGGIPSFGSPIFRVRMPGWGDI
jgi:hypothetical protein